MRPRRMLHGALAVLTAFALAACATLPTTGDVRPGRAAEQSTGDSDVTYLPQGPSVGATPEQIVRGFIDAASSPSDSWGIARQFLTASFQEQWHPNVGVLVDAGPGEREYAAPEPAEGDTENTVRLTLRTTGNVDVEGVYSPVAEGAGETELAFSLVEDGGEWRIDEAPDGIVLDAQSFAAADVFSPYTLTYFDPTWTYLVPDVRWFPKRTNTATRIVRALVSGSPAPWLVQSVRTAFTGDIELGRDSVTVESQVAEVELSSAALGADVTTRARMRTQLERSLKPLGVLEVRLTVDGRELETGAAQFTSTAVETRPLTLSERGFGYQAGQEVTGINGVSDLLEDFPQQITSITVDGGDRRAIVQAADGVVYSVSNGDVDEIDGRAGLLAPSLDPFGYVWTVPRSQPTSVLAWAPDVVATTMGGFAGATAITAFEVSRDGARAVAVLTSGTRSRVVVVGIEREADGTPVSLGESTIIGWLGGAALDAAWLDDTTVGIVVDDGEHRRLVQQTVGGTSTALDVPDDTVALAASTPVSSIRILGSDGTLRVRSGPVWLAEATGVAVLATQTSGL